ncbi:MAG TPA: orotidine-5'-phosphate decarboxylase [Gammaproteobacteria bacterium]
MSIPVRERLIVALDVPDVESAKSLVHTLGDAVVFYKIGLELAMSGRYFELLDWLLEQDKRVFADLKLYDIPATVAAAVRQLRDRGASFLTVHGERSVMEAAAREKGERTRILAVTVLTSIEQADLESVGIDVPVETLARRRAAQALGAGCDGVIASPLEARRLREDLGPGALIVTPGVRPAGSGGGDDQRRVATPRAALEAGADHIVVGRPIRTAADPREAARRIQAEIAGCFE